MRFTRQVGPLPAREALRDWPKERLQGDLKRTGEVMSAVIAFRLYHAHHKMLDLTRILEGGPSSCGTWGFEAPPHVLWGTPWVPLLFNQDLFC